MSLSRFPITKQCPFLVSLSRFPDLETRPILDRLKKSLFSMLDAAGLLRDCRVLDLYSGTGTLGLEALSRGAAFCHFVERRPEAVKLLKENLAKTRLEACAEVRQGDVGLALRGLLQALEQAPAAPPGHSARQEVMPFDLILHDPPFVFSREPSSRAACEAELASAGRLLAPTGRLVLRAEKKTEPPHPGGLSLVRHWTDGPHAFCFYALPV